MVRKKEKYNAIIEKMKNIVWLAGIVFSGCVFIQALITLAPRVTKLETRMTGCETKISGIEIKLDTLLHQSEESGKDIKDIYHLIMERHK